MEYKPSPRKLIITIEGGGIQAIEGGPADMDIEIWDFDADDDEVEVYEQGAEAQSLMGVVSCAKFWRMAWREKGVSL